MRKQIVFVGTLALLLLLASCLSSATQAAVEAALDKMSRGEPLTQADVAAFREFLEAMTTQTQIQDTLKTLLAVAGSIFGVRFLPTWLGGRGVPEPIRQRRKAKE